MRVRLREIAGNNEGCGLARYPLSQAHTETINSALKKCVGSSRHLLGSEQVGNEMAVRLLGPAAEDSEPIIHRVVHECSMAAARCMVSDDFDLIPLIVMVH